ncbi:hypothetical protein B0T14DRAFT_84201 [Immersiella caudata]|uniref:Uncharacterized protein n=1 Tax=Immersiella caudata TaxID=314043 RepID=A0AA39XH87_9PEZI|nr:hypothetical protein B0T14DRAFT_84201 [Immersiella caudata]
MAKPTAQMGTHSRNNTKRARSHDFTTRCFYLWIYFCTHILGISRLRRPLVLMEYQVMVVEGHLLLMKAYYVPLFAYYRSIVFCFFGLGIGLIILGG